MATLTESMELLKQILGRGCSPEDRKRYELEWQAYREVRDGDPYDATQIHHVEWRRIYTETRARAELQQKIHGNGGK